MIIDETDQTAIKQLQTKSPAPDLKTTVVFLACVFCTNLIQTVFLCVNCKINNIAISEQAREKKIASRTTEQHLQSKTFRKEVINET